MGMNKKIIDKVFEENTRVFSFVGAYGSGKSEVSVNFARFIKKEFPKRKVSIADLDIVNPFFRSADAKSILENEGIRAIIPNYANTNIDVPSLSGEAYSIFDDEECLGILDIGGEDLGAKILSNMKSRLDKVPHKMFMVVNTLRPFTATSEEIVLMAKELESASRFQISGIINNTNLLEFTTKKDIIESVKIIKDACDILNIENVFTTIIENDIFIDDIRNDIFESPVLVMNRTIFY